LYAAVHDCGIGISASFVAAPYVARGGRCWRIPPWSVTSSPRSGPPAEVPTSPGVPSWTILARPACRTGPRELSKR